MGRSGGVGDAEMEILRYVADHHPVTVGEVAEHVARTRGKARTTVQTVMERLREKGHLRREKIDGVYRYAPALSKAELMRRLVSRFVERTLGGSLEPFVAYLSRDARLTPAELDRLRTVLDELSDESGAPDQPGPPDGSGSRDRKPRSR